MSIVITPLTRAVQSDTLLDEAWAAATRSAFADAQHGCVGGLVLWDRPTTHQRDPLDNAPLHVVHRNKIKGTRAARAYVAAA